MLTRSLRTITRKLHSKQLMYSEYGDPSKVISLKAVEIPDKLAACDVLVRWVAAPVNPADLNQIQGVYPEKPASLPAIGGNEGFGVVEEVGSKVTSLKVGDSVIRNLCPPGTWRTFGHHKADDLFKIDSGLSTEAAATIQVNPPTAYRLLKDFVNLKSGDTVIQNGATSTVGRAVIQLCKAWGYKSVNLVRKRDDMSATVDDLKSLGADLVITEEQLIKEYRKEIKNVPLALDCVGGRSSMLLANCLGERGYRVTYGGMSRELHSSATGPLIFKNVVLTGFWLTKWSKDRNHDKEKRVMFDEICQLIKAGRLKPPKCEIRSLEESKDVLEKAHTVFGVKQLFKM